MPGEQYQALARVLRAPMRKWWRRVGVWWLAAAGVLVLLQAYESWHDLTRIKSLAFPFPAPALPDPISGCCWLILSVSAATAILCGFRVRDQVAVLSESAPVLKTGEISAYSFRLALLNCWPALLPPMAWAVAFFLQVYGTADLSVFKIVLLSLLEGVGYAMYSGMAVVWCVAFIILTGSNRLLVWLLFAGWVVAHEIRSFIGFGFPGKLVLFPQISRLDPSDFDRSALEFLGLILFYSAAYLVCTARRRLGYWVLTYLGGHMAIANFGVGFGVYWTDNLIQWGMYYTGGLAPISAGYSVFLEPTLYVHVMMYLYEFNVGIAWAVFPVLLGLFWLAVHITALYWLMGRLKWRQA